MASISDVDSRMPFYRAVLDAMGEAGATLEYDAIRADVARAEAELALAVRAHDTARVREWRDVLFAARNRKDSMLARYALRVLRSEGVR